MVDILMEVSPKGGHTATIVNVVTPSPFAHHESYAEMIAESVNNILCSRGDFEDLGVMWSAIHEPEYVTPGYITVNSMSVSFDPRKAGSSAPGKLSVKVCLTAEVPKDLRVEHVYIALIEAWLDVVDPIGLADANLIWEFSFEVDENGNAEG